MIKVGDSVAGIHMDSELKQQKMPYSYRICWLTGSGEEPQNHVEKK